MIMTDAKSKGVYALEGTKNQGSVKHKTHPKLLSLEEIEKLDFKEIFAISPENLLLEEKFQTLKLNIAPSKYNLENLSTFCFEKFTNFSEESKEEIEIHYLRLS